MEEIKQNDFQIVKITEILRELKEFESSLLKLEFDEKKEDRFELCREVIQAKEQLFNVLQENFDIEYSGFNTIEYILFSNENLIMIKETFLYFYKELSSIVALLSSEWDNFNMNLNSTHYIKQSDTTNKYITNLDFDYSSSNSNKNDF